MYHWLKKVEDDAFSRFEKILGTTWTLEELKELINPDPERSMAIPDKIRIPLSFIIQPSIIKTIRESAHKILFSQEEDLPGFFGKAFEKDGGNIQSEPMHQPDKQEFLNLIQGLGLRGVERAKPDPEEKS